MVGKFGKATEIVARSNRVSKGAQRILWAGKFDPYKKYPQSELSTQKNVVFCQASGIEDKPVAS